MFLTTHGKGRTRGLRRGLGTVSTPVGGALVYGSNPVAVSRPAPVSNIRYPVILPPIRIVTPAPTPAPTPTPAPINVRIGIGPTWGPNPPMSIFPGGYGPTWTAAGSPYGSTPAPVRGGASLSTAMALYQSNPSLLTQAQWTQLQQAGVVAGTVPYSSAGQTSGSGAIDPATGQTYASELAAAQAGSATAVTSSSDIGTTLDATYAGLPLYLWLIIGAGGLYLFTKKGR